jgi:tetratricopeptide (TPR) repeat protein
MALLKNISLVLLVLARAGTMLYAQAIEPGQLNPDSVNKLAEIYRKAGGEYYSKGEAEAAITNFMKAYELYQLSLNSKDMAICLHSIAFAYDELLHNDQQALQYVEKSIVVHQNNNDTLEMANMYKYMGMLKARLGKYAPAKEDIRAAVNYFSLKNYEPGIAVSMYDMALVYINEKKADSALFYLEKAKMYWVERKNPGRIFGINNTFIELAHSINDTGKGSTLINENRQILTSGNIYFRDKLKFYYLAAKFYGTNSMPGQPDYTGLYNRLADSLTRQGIQVEQ